MAAYAFGVDGGHWRAHTAVSAGLSGHQGGTVIRRHALIALLAIGLFGSSLAVPTATVALDGTERLPDLGMLPPKDFSIQQRPRGVRLLRFDSVIVNAGTGVFEAEGRGPIVGDTIGDVVQLVETAGGGRTEVASPATMFFAGDGHNHWHVRDLQAFTIARVTDPGNVLKRGAKSGFCFWDNYRYGSTRPAFYHPSTTSACALTEAGTVPMGLSVGWGDEYPSSIAFQYIDITGLPNGDYVVTLVADPPRAGLAGGEFVEANESNNKAWARIRIAKKGITVLATGTDLAP